MSTIKLSIVIGAYHEADRITESLQALAAAVPQYLDPATTEVIIVAADSPDHTAQVAGQSKNLFKHFTVIEPGRRVGKGRDIRVGMLAARGEYRMFMDADMATPLHHLKQVATFIESGKEMAIGIRHLAEIHKGFRKAVSEVGNVLVQTFLTPGISDSQCGFKIFRADIAELLFNRMTILGWGFDMELLVIARLHKIPVEKLSIPDWHDPKEEGLTGDSSFKVVIATGVELLTILGNRLRGRYN